MNVETRLADLIRQEIKQAGGVPPAELRGASLLAQTGLDSLGFASVVVVMEQQFGVDPFGSTDDIIYPETFGEMVSLYKAELCREEGSAQ